MIITRTPFRISFFGGGTDYPAWYEKHGGAVLSTTIDKYCYLSCRYLPPFFEYKSRIVWSQIEIVKKASEINHPAVRGALQFLNINDGLEIHHNGDLPARSGLGSSSSFAVGLLHALHALRGELLSKRELALRAIHLEQGILKENVGSQDQVAAAYGGLNIIQLGPLDKLVVTPVAINSEKLLALQDHLMLVFTGLSRHASKIAAEQIKNTRRNSDDLQAMREMVNMATAILTKPKGNLDAFGQLLHETWQLKRGLSSKIANSMVDDIYSQARKAGALGGKLLGAGGGGFMLFFAHPEAQPKIKARLKNFLHVPFRFERAGSQIIYYEPSTESTNSHQL